MLNPNQLSDVALAVLRLIAQSGTREAGSSLTIATIERSWKRTHGDLEVGLSDLEVAGLVRQEDDPSPSALVTEEGAAFFKRYYWSCH